MASFYAYDFIYDGVPSSSYGLKIISFGEGGITDGIGSSDVEIYTQKVLRKAKVYFLGRSQTPTLEFKLMFGTELPMNALDRNVISSWLFGKNNYKKLQIVQSDLENLYFNCFLKNPIVKYIGNLNYAFEATVCCDSPFAYTFTKTFTKTFASNIMSNYNFNFYNGSSEDDYLYPNITFTLNNLGSSFLLTNYTDNNRAFSFTGISPNETIIVNNDIQTITSSLGLLRMSKFNKHWLRFVKGLNQMNVVGGINTFTISYNLRSKVGG